MEASQSFQQQHQQGISPSPQPEGNFGYNPGNEVSKQQQPPEYAPAQQQVPQQQAVIQPTGAYIMETPIPSLGEHPAVVRCTRCSQVGMTRVEYESGSSTHGWAALLCICCCLGCIPYMMGSLKDVVHYCQHCNGPLVTWHRSGRTTIHAPAPQQPQQPAPDTNKYQ